MKRSFVLLCLLIAGSIAQVCDPPCQNTGVCLAGNPKNTCFCPQASGWTGATCAVPICANPCLNGGLCTAPNVCECAEGYSGPTCALPNCTLPCENNGTCVAKDTCDCTGTGYSGAQCEVAVCDPTCKAGVCDAPNHCNCAGTGWTGFYCEKPTCNPPCMNGVCGPSPDACDCTGTDFTGTRCEIPVCTPPCENGGVCAVGNVCDCTMLKGWMGARCDEAICGKINCTHNGKCSGPDTCLCEGTGYAGTRCEVDINECSLATNPCDPIAIGGCTNSVGNYSCGTCPTGYSGDGKVENGGCVDINECTAGGYCDPLVTCVNSLGSFQCGKCPPGYSGSGSVAQGGCQGKGGSNSVSPAERIIPDSFLFCAIIFAFLYAHELFE